MRVRLPKVVLILSFIVVSSSIDTAQDKWTNQRPIIELEEGNAEDMIKNENTVLIYFHHEGQIDSKSKDDKFLWHLQKAAKYLHSQSYGVLIAKVDCIKKLSSGICSNQDTVRNVYIFRNGKKVVLSLESLPDYHAISASLMHIDLIERVPILKTGGERRSLEKRCLGNCDILLIYVPFLGGYEHRIFMEITYSFLDQYLCALTTSLQVTDDLLKPPYAEEDPSDAAREPLLWALLCSREVTTCRKYLHRGVVQLDSVTRFLSALKLPEWSQAWVDDGGRLTNVYEQPDIDIPVVYVIYGGADSKDVALRSAGLLSAIYRGAAGIALLSRDSVPDILKRTLVGHGKSVSLELLFREEPQPFFSPPHGRVTFVFLDGIKTDAGEVTGGKLSAYPTIEGITDFLRDFFEEKRRRLQNRFGDAKTDYAEEIIPQLIQDDPVSQLVQRMGKPDWKTVVSLTERNFAEYQKNKTNLFVLFYLPWDSASQLVTHVVNSISKRLRLGIEDNKRTLLAKMDCYDWTYFCQKRGVFTFPSFVFYGTNSVIAYNGVYEKTALQTFVNKHRTPNRRSYFCDKEKSCEKPNNFPELNGNTLRSILRENKMIALLIGIKIRETTNYALIKGITERSYSLPVAYCWLDSELKLGSEVSHFYNLSTEVSLLLVKNNQSGIFKFNGAWNENELNAWIEKATSKLIKPSFFKKHQNWEPLQSDFNFLEKIEEDAGDEKISMEADISLDIFQKESIPHISKMVKSGKKPVSPVSRMNSKRKEL